jgi:hypothetical protein
MEISQFIVKIQRKWDARGGFEEMVASPLGE